MVNVLVREIFCRFGTPRILHSDQGRTFESKVMAEVADLLGIWKTQMTPYHSQSDGQVERLGGMLATVVAVDPMDWDLHKYTFGEGSRVWMCR